MELAHGALRMGAKIECEALAWVRTGRPSHPLWPDEVLAPARDLLGEQGLLQDLERDPHIADFLIPEAEWLTAELACSSVAPARREEIGSRLAQVGDPGTGVGLSEGTPAIAWRALPPGEVRVEGHGVFQVPALRIAALPVTQVQFESFLDAADGFHRPDWWERLRRRAPPSGRLPRHGSYPATQVSWFDATAFCRWLSARLRSLVRLPDEWEWQWAAQSARPGFVYPWGREWRDGHGNTEETGLGRVTAVGLHPVGGSLQGVYDLAGNAWEWCRNRYDQPRIVAPDVAGLPGPAGRFLAGEPGFRPGGLPARKVAGRSLGRQRIPPGDHRLTHGPAAPGDCCQPEAWIPPSTRRAIRRLSPVSSGYPDATSRT